MNYDFQNLRSLKYPTGDDTLVNICRILAIKDASLQVNAVVGALDLGREFCLDILSPDDDIVKYVTHIRPDVIVMNIDMLDDYYITDITLRINEQMSVLPALVSLGQKGKFDAELERILKRYHGRLHLDIPESPLFNAEVLRAFVLHYIVNRDHYKRRLRECCELTLKHMGADIEDRESFGFMTDAVMAVLENAYFHFTVELLITEVSKRKGASEHKVSKAFDRQINAIRQNISEENRKVAFEELIARGLNPTTIDIFYSAAKITSGACRLILTYLDKMPAQRRPYGKHIILTKNIR
ncbi:MAG: hypothetical protein J6M17_03925 [Ruminococcus sp.]|nr:hypothetical protein [Ruminococcus sp.]